MKRMTADSLSPRRIVAGLLFLLAALVAFYGVAYLYLSAKYPTSAQLIETSLDSLEIAGHFKVNEAKKSGYSAQEIASYLAERNYAKFDLYMGRVFFSEAAIFVVAVLLGAGCIVLGLRRSDAKQ